MSTESEAALDLLMRLYGDRLTPDMASGLKGSVEALMKTIDALRAVPLTNANAPLEAFAPYVEEEGSDDQ